MKYYAQLNEIKVFSLNDATNLMKNRANAAVILNNMIKKKQVLRVKQNLYVSNDLYKDKNAKFKVGSHINDDSVIAYQSALEFYGIEPKELNTVQIASSKRFYDLSFNGNDYHFCKSIVSCQVNVINDIKVTSIERTIIDCINTIGKEIELTNLVRCLNRINKLDDQKIKEVLLAYNKDVLYRKTGYVLSFFKDQIGLSNEIFTFCNERSNVKNKAYLLSSDKDKLVYIKEWGIYAYKDLLTDNLS